MNILIISSNSRGLRLDAEILEQTLTNQASALQTEVSVRTVQLPWQVYMKDSAVRHERLKLTRKPDVVIYLENIPAIAPGFSDDVIQILVPNPEWMSTFSEARLGRIHQIWHKSQMSLTAFSQTDPAIQHHYVGFTSKDPGVQVKDYSAFGHFRGKATKRHSNEIIAAWKANAQYPLLKHHFYTDGIDPSAFHFDDWLAWENVRIRIGEMDMATYFAELRHCGIHLCTSASEGFGHYINEARAMAAVAVVIDAPPMNELIDQSSGFLIPPRRALPRYRGQQFSITADDIAGCIDGILDHSQDQLSAIGQNARQRFLDDRDAFQTRLGVRLADLSQAVRSPGP